MISTKSIKRACRIFTKAALTPTNLQIDYYKITDLLKGYVNLVRVILLETETSNKNPLKTRRERERELKG
jgi:hypothetical protein